MLLDLDGSTREEGEINTQCIDVLSYYHSQALVILSAYWAGASVSTRDTYLCII